MSLQQPTYWLAYLAEATETGPAEITATAPEILDRPRFTRDARVLLAAADAYHDVHPHERVVFAAAITRWLRLSQGIRWPDLDIDFYEALADLDAHAPALLITASPVAMAVVGNAAVHLDILVDRRRDRRRRRTHRTSARRDPSGARARLALLHRPPRRRGVARSGPVPPHRSRRWSRFSAARTAENESGNSARTATTSARSLVSWAHVSRSSATCDGDSGAIA